MLPPPHSSLPEPPQAANLWRSAWYWPPAGVKHSYDVPPHLLLVFRFGHKDHPEADGSAVTPRGHRRN
jgi:hypothetical protein